MSPGRDGRLPLREVVLPVAVGWGLLTLLLCFRSLPVWAEAAVRFYDAAGRAAPLSLAGLASVALGHAAAGGGLVLLLLGAYGAGWPLVRLLGLRATAWPRAVLQLAAGWVVVSLGQHGLGLAGLFHPGVLISEAGVALGFGVLSALRHKPWRRLRIPATDPSFWLSVAVFAALFALARVPEVLEDARVRHFAAPEHYLFLGKINAEPQHTGWHMPLGFEMAVVLAWALGGIALAKLLNAALALTGALVVKAIADRLRPEAGWWAVLWYGAAGVVVDECWQGKNDLALAVNVAAAAWCGVEALRGSRRWWLGVAWFLGAAAGTKYTAVFFLVGLAGPLLFCRRSLLAWRALAPAIGVGLVPVGGWLLANLLFLGNPFHPFLSWLFPGLSWGPFYERGYHEYVLAVSPPETRLARDWLVGAWRVLGDPGSGSPAIAALLPLAFMRRGGLTRERGVVCLAVALGLAYAAWLPTERVARYLFPVLPMAAVVAGLVEVTGRSREATWFRAGRAVLAGAAAVLAALNAFSYLAPGGWFHLTGQVTTAELHRGRYTSWDAVRRWVNRDLPDTARVLFTGESKRLWFRPRVISDSSVTEPLFWRLTLDSRSPGEVRKRLRQKGITHHLHNFPSSEYRRLVYWAGPEWSDRQLKLYAEFTRRYVRAAHSPSLVDHLNGGFYVFEFLPRPSPRALPVMFLPFTEGRLLRSYQLLRADRVAEARVEAERVLRPVRDSLCAQFVLAALAGRAGEHAEAARLLRPGIEAGYVANGNWGFYGGAVGQMGRRDEAVKAFCGLARVDPRPESWDLLAAAYLERCQQRIGQGRMPAACRDAEQAAILRPENVLALRLAVATLRGLGRPAEAIGYAQRLLRQSPKDLDLFNLIRELEYEIKRRE